MPAKPLILAIDNGTQSVRALLFDTNGNLVGKGKQEIEPYFSQHPGWAEQHPEYFWESLGKACALLWQSTDTSPDQVAGVTVTTQRGTVINLDGDGKPLRPAIIWLDQRHARVDGPVRGPWGWLFRLARLDDTITRFREKTQANWIAQNQPEIWSKTRHFLLLSGYLNYRLTGQFRDSTGNQVGYLPFDYRKHRWAGRRPPGTVPGSAGYCRSLRQGLRSAGLRRPDPGYRLHELWHHRHHQHHQPALCGTHTDDAALSFCTARALFHGSDDLPGLLDGELVQAGIRAAGEAPG